MANQQDESTDTGEIATITMRIKPEWTDYNGHLNVTWITHLFDLATDAMLDRFGLGEAYAYSQNCSTFALESHVRYLGEAAEGDDVTIASHLVAVDNKRIRYVHLMNFAKSGTPLSTLEQLSIHVDLAERRSVPWSVEMRARLDALAGPVPGTPFCPAIRIGEARS